MRPRLTPDPTPVQERTGSRWWDAPGELRGINLRSWLVLELADTNGPVTVAELIGRVRMSGLRVEGRASKTISDALRWEVLRGRAVRLARGRYSIGRLARSTRHRMQHRLQACQARTAAPSSERPGVRLACDIFNTIRAVAQTRNTTHNPHPDQTVITGRPPP